MSIWKVKSWLFSTNHIVLIFIMNYIIITIRVVKIWIYGEDKKQMYVYFQNLQLLSLFLKCQSYFSALILKYLYFILQCYHLKTKRLICETQFIHCSLIENPKNCRTGLNLLLIFCLLQVNASPGWCYFSSVHSHSLYKQPWALCCKN